MLKIRCTLVISCLFLLASLNLIAQVDQARPQTCEGNPYQHVVDSLKSVFALQGFSILREASMQMESEYELPIVLPMEQGTFYQFVFIGDPSSRVNEVRMCDYESVISVILPSAEISLRVGYIRTVSF